MDAGGEGFAFDGDFAEEAEAVGVGGQAVAGEVADDDVGGVFGAAGERLEAGGEVHAVADDGVVEAAVGADVAGDDGGGVDADAEGERRAAFGGEFAVEGGEGFAHAEGGADGAVGAVGDIDGGAEERHDFGADVFVDDAALAFDFGAHAVEVAVEEGEEFGRREGFAERGEAAQVGEEDGDLAFLAAEGGAVFEEAGGDLGGDVFVEEVADLVAFGEAGAHDVEGFGEAAEFVGAGEVDAGGVVAGGDEAGVAGEAADGLAEGAGEEEGGGHGDDKAGEGDGGEDGFEPAGGGEFGGEGALEDDPDGLSVGRGDGAEGGDVFFAAQGDVDGGEGA